MLYIFLHIPKAAGCSVRELFPEGVLLTHEPNETNEDAGKRLRSAHPNLTAIYGHAPYYGIHELWDKKPYYLTMLRYPTTHVLSIYNYLHQELPANRNKTDRWREINESIKDLSFRQFSQQFVNPQTYYLTSKLKKEYPSQSGIVNAPLQPNLNDAKRLLDLCNYVGIVEQNGIQNLAKLLNKTPPPPLNKTRDRRHELQPGDEEWILEHNELDLKLYNYALVIKGENRELD